MKTAVSIINGLKFVVKYAKYINVVIDIASYAAERIAQEFPDIKPDEKAK